MIKTTTNNPLDRYYPWQPRDEQMGILD